MSLQDMIILQNKCEELEEKLAVAEEYKEMWQSIAGKANLLNLVSTLKDSDEKLSHAIEGLEKMADFNVIMDRRAAASEVLEKIKR